MSALFRHSSLSSTSVAGLVPYANRQRLTGLRGTVRMLHARRGYNPERAASISNSWRKFDGMTTDNSPSQANSRAAWLNKSAKGRVAALRAIVLAAVLLSNVPA